MWDRAEDQHTISRFHQLHHQQLAIVRLANISNGGNSRNDSEQKPVVFDLKALFLNDSEPVLNRTTERVRWISGCKCELNFPSLALLLYLTRMSSKFPKRPTIYDDTYCTVCKLIIY
jgi:hypothetical protein